MRGSVAEEVGKTDEMFQKLLNGTSLEETIGQPNVELVEAIKEDG
jgi:hypothetical protein